MEEAGSSGGGLRTRVEVAAVAGAGRRTHGDGEIENGFCAQVPGRIYLNYMDQFLGAGGSVIRPWKSVSRGGW